MRLLSVRCGWIACCFVIAIGTCSNVQAADSTLLAGAYAQDITPPKFPISVNGNMSDQLAMGAHDPLHARCIVLKQQGDADKNSTTLAIVVCDSCMIPRDLIERAKIVASVETRIPASNILISATHAHSCPTVAGVFQSHPDLGYTDFLIEKIAEGIKNAQQQLEPGRIGWGSFRGPDAEKSTLLFNRRWLLKEGNLAENPFGSMSDRVLTNPGLGNPRVERSIGLIDPELSIVSIQSKAGRPIALLANYSLHYVGGVAGNVVSADYFGEFSQRVARHLKATDMNPPFVGIMSNGTSGDVNNVDFRQKSLPSREPFEQIQFVAEAVAEKAAQVCQSIEYQTRLTLDVRETELELGVRKPTAEEALAAEKKIAAAQRPLQGLPMIYARETTLLAQYPPMINVKLQGFRIGSLAIVTSPCETFTETGLAIKAKSPFPATFTISLANGYNGYLPPPEQHELGGYETWRARSSYLAKDAEPKVRAALLGLLSDLNQ
jgi:neutral ceramidase